MYVQKTSAGTYISIDIYQRWSEIARPRYEFRWWIAQIKKKKTCPWYYDT